MESRRLAAISALILMLVHLASGTACSEKPTASSRDDAAAVNPPSSSAYNASAQPVQPEGDAASATPPPAPRDDADTAAYGGPSIALDAQFVDVPGGAVQCNTVATVTFPTGGWNIASDKAEIRDGIVQWYVTITRPAPDEIVTQALQTRMLMNTTGSNLFSKAQLHVNLVVRGQEPAAPNYVLAAVWPPL